VLSLIVTLQSVTISFRDERQAGKYTIVVIASLLLTVLGSTDIPMEARLSVLLALIVSSVLLYLVVRIRSRFYYKMRAQQDVLKAIVTSSENGILILNMKGLVTDANSKACELLRCGFSG
jgi:sensor histidine kinase regulating citrate/malate metabolism